MFLHNFGKKPGCARPDAQENKKLLTRAVGLVLLLLLPSLLLFSSGQPQIARLVVLGTLFAFHLGVLARPIAPFALLIPLVYAAAAITASFTDGVAALIVAVAAATGASSSAGYHRGLLAVLAAALIGSFEPAAATDAARSAAYMMGGCACGWLAASTIGRWVTVQQKAVNSQTALGYAVLLAVLVVIAWFTARAAGLAHAWWLPLTVAALGDPWLSGTPARAVRRLALGLSGTLLAVAALAAINDPMLRVACAAALIVAVLSASPARADLRAFLLTPLLVLVASEYPGVPPLQFLQTSLLAFVVVATCTVLGKWMLWTLRPDSGRVLA